MNDERAEVDKLIGKAAELREAEYRAECDMAAANDAEPPDFMEWLQARHAEWRAAQDKQWLLEQAMRLMKLDDDRAAAEAQASEDAETFAGLLSTDEDDIKARMKALGYAKIPGNPADRVAVYKQMKTAAQPALVTDDPDAAQAASDTAAGLFD